MPGPQKENGYTPIANEIMEALSKYSIPGTQMQCLLVVLRKTYGYSKKTDAISLSQFEKFTNLDRRHIHRAIKELQKKNIIMVLKRSAKDGTKKTSEYRLNKIYTSWVFVPKKARGSAIKGTKGSAKLGTDINNLKTNKEKYIKEKYIKENLLGVFKTSVNIPENYSIQPEHLKYALSKKLSEEQAKDQFEAFKIHFQKTGKKYQSWYATYQTWIRNSISFGKVSIIKNTHMPTQAEIKKQNEAFLE